MIFYVTAIAIIGLSCHKPGDVSMSKYLHSDGTLTQSLVVQDVQAGVVGQAGTEIVIQPDGAWTKFQFWGEKRRKELGQGKLSPDEVKSLASVLAEQKVAELPREFGRMDATSNPNPRYLIFKFGNEHSKLLLPPKTGFAEYVQSANSDTQEMARRLKAVITKVEKLVSDVR